MESLSETDPLPADATLNGAAVNYIQWLRAAPIADLQAENYPGNKPTALLYRILRQSVLREYVGLAGRAQVAQGTLPPISAWRGRTREHPAGHAKHHALGHPGPAERRRLGIELGRLPVPARPGARVAVRSARRVAGEPGQPRHAAQRRTRPAANGNARCLQPSPGRLGHGDSQFHPTTPAWGRRG